MTLCLWDYTPVLVPTLLLLEYWVKFSFSPHNFQSPSWNWLKLSKKLLFSSCSDRFTWQLRFTGTVKLSTLRMMFLKATNRAFSAAGSRLWSLVLEQDRMTTNLTPFKAVYNFHIQLVLPTARGETVMVKGKGGRDCGQKRFLGEVKRHDHLTTCVAGWL